MNGCIANDLFLELLFANSRTFSLLTLCHSFFSCFFFSFFFWGILNLVFPLILSRGLPFAIELVFFYAWCSRSYRNGVSSTSFAFTGLSSWRSSRWYSLNRYTKVAVLWTTYNGLEIVTAGTRSNPAGACWRQRCRRHPSPRSHSSQILEENEAAPSTLNGTKFISVPAAVATVPGH